MSSAEILRWYAEAGVDEVLLDTPQDRLRPKPPVQVANDTSQPMTLPEPVASFSAPLMPQQARPGLDAAIAEARRLSDTATTRDELEAAIRSFEGCALKKTAKKTVVCDGNPAAKVMLIGEAPGASEDEQGIPFCGTSGMLLDAMLKAIGLERATSIYITNTIFWRPPANRQPTEDETDICRPFVEKHIALIDPALIILCGGTATRSVLQKQVGITKLRGHTYSYSNKYMQKEIPAAILFHPSYLLRQPGMKRLAWQDLLSIRELIKSADTTL